MGRRLVLKGRLINLGGWNSKGKAYTLIEVIVSIAISIIVMIIGSTLVITTYKTYIDVIEDNIIVDSVDNTLLTIDRLLTGYMIVDIIPNSENNEIRINYLIDHKKTDVKSKIIKYRYPKLSVETQSGGRAGTNTILNGVKEFDIIQKEKLYYYKITLITGEEIINCI